jgi:hypothetical protein
MDKTIADEGPWQVDVWKPVESDKDKRSRVVLQSHQFQHDVALIVTGDFEDMAQRMAYAEALAKQLNESTKLLMENGWTR